MSRSLRREPFMIPNYAAKQEIRWLRCGRISESVMRPHDEHLGGDKGYYTSSSNYALWYIRRVAVYPDVWGCVRGDFSPNWLKGSFEFPEEPLFSLLIWRFLESITVGGVLACYVNNIFKWAMCI